MVTGIERRLEAVRHAGWHRPMLVIVVLIVAFICACKKSENRCVPGASVQCACTGGTMGVQVCKADGTFAPCQCAESIGTQKPPAASGQAAIKCDPSGKWQLTVVWEKGTCSERKPLDLAFILAVNKRGKQELRAVRGQPPKLVGIKEHGGACLLELRDAFDLCPSCRPPLGNGTMRYDLEETGGVVKGHGRYQETAYDDRDLSEKPSCSHAFRITGSKSLATDADTAFDSEHAKAAFVDLYQEVLHECDLPAVEAGSTGLVSADLIVKKNGGIEDLLVNGRAQKLTDACPERDWPLLDAGRFPNPSGARQSIKFSLSLKPHPSR